MTHPEPETLAAYHAGELAQGEVQRLQEHLLACRECAALLLDLDGLADPDFGAGSLSATDQEALWGRIQGEIAQEETPPTLTPLAPVIPLRRPARFAPQPRWLQALAASLLVATVGLSAWVVSLRHTVTELSQPQPNASVIQLSPLTTRGARGSEPVPGEARRFTVVLYLPGAGRAAEYRAEVLRADGGRAAEVPGLMFNEDLAGVSLELSRDEIGPGDYRLRLYGSTGQGAPEKVVAEYRLHVEVPRKKP
ncbi:MAG TPA: zf-HC2 domain-containing protein [Thermoanaerobaculia bacterium]|nr:zf-HC2 domain-containing protein [Thermoanaerobaculia bacterium]